MGKQIIKQPDGRFCIFSTNTDDLILCNLTRDEVIDYFSDYPAERQDRDRELELVEADQPAYYQFTMTFVEAVEHRNMVHRNKFYEGHSHVEPEELKQIIEEQLALLNIKFEDTLFFDED